MEAVFLILNDLFMICVCVLLFKFAVEAFRQALNDSDIEGFILSCLILLIALIACMMSWVIHLHLPSETMNWFL